MNGKGAQPAAPETEELAQVVVATATESDPSRRWYVTLRPWLFCMLFLLLAEAGTRVYFDTTVCLRRERFDNFATAAAQDIWVEQIARDSAFRVVLIGDSAAVGPKLMDKDKTIACQLEDRLNRDIQGRPVHVWNMSLPGMRPVDQFCMLLKLLPAKPDLVILSANYTSLSMDVGETPIMHPWLATNLSEIPRSIRPLLKTDDYKTSVETTLTDFVEKHVRLIGMRQSINAKLFGEQPRTKNDNPNPIAMTWVRIAKQTGIYRLEPDKNAKAAAIAFRRMYEQPVKADSPQSRYYPEIFQALRDSATPAVVYLTPQNREYVDSLLTNSEYAESRATIASYFRDTGIPYYDWSDLVPTTEFKDNNHMMPAGNGRVADALAEAVLPLIKERLDRKR